METRILLFEDHFLRDMDPICLTRPAFSVTCACYTLSDIVSLVCGEAPAVVRGYLGIVAGRSRPARPS